MLRKVISGGQTGVDQAFLRAAWRACLETGGTAPKGWRTDKGPNPGLAQYGLKEHWFSNAYPTHPRGPYKSGLQADYQTL
jgi:hypothetical protein